MAQSNEFHRRTLISKYEVTGGAGLLNSSSYYASYGTGIGYSFGVGVSHTFSKSFDLKARILYELKGSTTRTRAILYQNGTETDITRVLRTDLYYLTLAVLPTFHITSNRKVVIGAGGFYSFNRDVNLIEARTDNMTGITATITHNSPNALLENDFGASIYGGYLFSLSGETDLTLMLHYNKSLTDYVDALNTWQRNNVILISVTFGLLRSP